MERQLTIFDDVEADTQVGWLLDFIEKKEDQQANFANMVNAYKNNDLEGLFKIMLEAPEMKDYADLLLYKRNTEWIPKMEERMKAQATFFAVGAGHLPSDKGVVQLLRAKGYTVEAIQINE